MPWSILLNPRIMGTLAAVVILAGSFIGVYFKGKSIERAKWELAAAKIQADAEQKVREIEQLQSSEIQKASGDYEQKIQKLHTTYNSALDGVRLRLKKCSDNHLPATSGAAGGSHAAAANSRDGAGEINLDGTAKRLLELGRDLDACSAQVTGLQELVTSYTNQKGN